MTQVPASDEIRRQLLARRKALSPQEVQSLSESVCRGFTARVPAQNLLGLRIGLYRALPGELELGALENELARAGARLCFPRIMDRGGAHLEMVEVPVELLRGDSNDPWVKGHYGVSEPPLRLKEVPAESLDLLFVPSVALGKNGERIGMGAGYYDRFLLRASNALRFALVFDFQLLDQIEQKPWDQPVHWIFTERREVKTPAAAPYLSRLGFLGK